MLLLLECNRHQDSDGDGQNDESNWIQTYFYMIQYCPFCFGWQDSYNRGQEHPFFAGLLRGNESGSRSISRSTSDIGDFRSKIFSDISGKSKDCQ